MSKFFERLFKKDKHKDTGSPGRDPASLPDSGQNARNGKSAPIGLGRSRGHDLYEDDPYDDCDASPDLKLEIPATLRPQASRDDFDPLGILGKGSFATVVLVRAKPSLPTQSNQSKPSSLATRVGGLLSSSPKGSKAAAASSPPKTAKASTTQSASNVSSSTNGTGYGPNKDLYAMKIIAKRRLIDSKRMRDVFTERDVLTKASHPYLLKLHYTFQSENKLFFVMDFMAGGDIRQLINDFRRRREPMPYEMARLLAAEVTLALTHLHDHGILYRDLKPENILLSEEGHCALADFGLSKDFGDLWMDEDEEVMRLKDKVPSMRATSFVGSPLYVAPEVLLREKYTKPIDFWGLGILIFTLLFGAEPFRGSNAKEIFDKILSKDVRFPTSMTTTPEAMDIIVQLLHKEPDQRLGAPEIFAHPFFKGLDWSAVMRQEITPVGWTPPISVVSGAPLSTIGGDSSRNLLAQQFNGGPLGTQLLPTHSGRARGMSEVYTPDHHVGQLRVSQQCFFENFSWTNVEHLQALSGESQIILSDGTIIQSNRDFSGRGDHQFSSERSQRDSSQQSEFYDAPLETPTSSNSGMQQEFSDFVGVSSNFGLSARGVSPPPVSFRDGRLAQSQQQQQYQTRQHTVKPQPRNLAHPPSSTAGGGGVLHVQAIQSSPVSSPPPSNARLSSGSGSQYQQQLFAHPDMAAGHARGSSSISSASLRTMNIANYHVRMGSQNATSSSTATMGGKQQSTSSFFAPPPSEGFDSQVSLDL